MRLHSVAGRRRKYDCGDLWSDTNRGKPRYSERACPSATFSAIYSTETGLGSKLGLRGERLPRLFCGIISLPFQ